MRATRDQSLFPCAASTRFLPWKPGFSRKKPGFQSRNRVEDPGSLYRIVATERRHGGVHPLVLTLRVGTHVSTLRVASVSWRMHSALTARDAERPCVRSHEERGNEESRLTRNY